jgi:hypothetical protein
MTSQKRSRGNSAERFLPVPKKQRQRADFHQTLWNLSNLFSLSSLSARVCYTAPEKKENLTCIWTKTEGGTENIFRLRVSDPRLFWVEMMNATFIQSPSVSPLFLFLSGIISQWIRNDIRDGSKHNHKHWPNKVMFLLLLLLLKHYQKKKKKKKKKCAWVFWWPNPSREEKKKQKGKEEDEKGQKGIKDEKGRSGEGTQLARRFGARSR